MDAINLLIISPTRGGMTSPTRSGSAHAATGHAVTYVRMDDLAGRLVISHSDGITHKKLLGELSQADLLIIDDFLSVGIDSDSASDLFAILANRQHRLPTVLASQTGPSHGVTELPDRVAPDYIVNQLANHVRNVNIGQIDMRRLRQDHARATENY